jgi:hypothetical protein
LVKPSGFLFKESKSAISPYDTQLFFGGYAPFKDRKTNIKGHVYARVFRILLNTHKVIVMLLSF